MYCKNCKHFRKTEYRFGYCNAPLPVVIENLMEREAVVPDPSINVECDMYEDSEEIIAARNTPEFKQYISDMFGPDT